MGLIRLLLAVSVVIFHGARPIFGLTFVGGFPAVFFFFIISGFYMAMILNEKYSDYRAFIISRFLKIFPSYWVILIMCACFKTIHFFAYGFWGGIYFILSNLFIFGSQFTSIIYAENHALHFLPLGDGLRSEIVWNMLYIGPIWSLSIELLFYLCAPFCVKAGRHLWMRLSLLPILSVLAYSFLAANGSWILPWGYNFFAPCAYLFALGACAYFLYKKILPYVKKLKYLDIFGCILLVAYIFDYQFLPQDYDLPLIGGSVSLKMIGVGLFTLCLPFAFQATKSSSIDRFIGNLSYPVYISHMFFIHYYPHMKHGYSLTVTLIFALIMELTVMQWVEHYRVKFMH